MTCKRISITVVFYCWLEVHWQRTNAVYSVIIIFFIFTATSDEVPAANAGTADISMPKDKAELNKIFLIFNYINSIYNLYIYYVVIGSYFGSE